MHFEISITLIGICRAVTMIWGATLLGWGMLHAHQARSVATGTLGVALLVVGFRA